MTTPPDLHEEKLDSANKATEALLGSFANCNDTLRSRGFTQGSTEQRVIAMAQSHDTLKDAYAKLEADAAMMREALEGYAQCGDGCTCDDGWSHDSAKEALATNSGKNLLERVKRLEGALKSSDELIHDAQNILTEFLIPGGTIDKAIVQLVELFDCPKQREVQNATQTALQHEQGAEVGITRSTPQA